MSEEIKDAINRNSKDLRNKFHNKIRDRNLLSLFQVMYRSFAIENRSYFVLHGSCAVTKYGNCVLFGDDGNIASGKTLLSLSTAAESGKYLCDEYTLIETKTKLVFGNGDIPINLKGDSSMFLKEEYSLILRDPRIIFANDYFKIIEKNILNLIIVPYMNANKTEVVIPVEEEKKMLIKSTLYGHIIKYLNPQYDHLTFSLKDETKSHKDLRSELQKFEDYELNIPVIKLFIKNVNDIKPTLEDIYQNINFIDAT